MNVEKMGADLPLELTDDQMTEVAAGAEYNKEGYELLRGKNGKLVGMVNTSGRIMYWKCTHCGLPIYDDHFVYRCDKCNDWWLCRTYYTWEGTREELIAASALTL